MTAAHVPNRPMGPDPGGQELPAGTGNLGMWLFLAALSMLFGATVVGYLFIRAQATTWPPAGMPALPLSLIASTVLILASSFTAQGALMAARAQRHDVLMKGLLLTFVLGLLFFVSQSVSWAEMFPAVQKIGLRGVIVPGAPRPDPTARQFAFLFYTLTVLHALHVLGGLIAFALVRFGRLVYRQPVLMLGRVRHAVVYWHFLAAVWVVLYAVLLI